MPSRDDVRVFHGDAFDVLRTLPDASIDAIVTDPPYGLAEHKPATIAAAMAAWCSGDRDHVPDGRGFMGRDWDGFVPPPAVWDECLRVLKPGGYLLCFAGSRTADLMGISIRLSGFEIRDTITWHYGSGFPKSLDVSKAIDKAAGAEREVVGAHVHPGETNGTLGRFGDRWAADVTAPATDAARRWSGWGTALKPASEPIIVARKPLGTTVAACVLAHGTGALNIDATRVGTNGGGTSCSNRDEVGQCRGHHNAGRSTSGETLHGPDTRTGRWPTNAVFSHLPECVEVGTRTVRTGTAVNRNRTGRRPSDVGYAPPGVDPVDVTYAGADGTEEIPAVACVEGCPVAELDAQSGTLTTNPRTYRRKREDATGARSAYTVDPPAGHVTSMGDTGGASRFFPTFRYQAKATTRERPKVDGVAHPTVKPLALMRWLVRLVTPPGGRVLDPFAGSGTTLQAARDEGFHAVGIERETTYLPLIAQRLTRAHVALALRSEDVQTGLPFDEMGG